MIRSYRILIIEDNEVLRTILNDFFEKKHYDTVFASDGMDGLKMLQNGKKKFDLVITDIVMPHISGLGIISVLKTKHPDIPVIAITGWGKQPIELASEARADRVMAKPFKLEELESLIIDLILQKNTESTKQTP